MVCLPIAHGWLAHLLAYRVTSDPLVTTARVVAVMLAVVCLYFTVLYAGRIGWDRALIYGVCGLLVLLQEGNQIGTHAPFLVWRLPLLLLLMLLCLSSMRKYTSGHYQTNDERET